MTGAPICPISVSIVIATAIICKGESILRSLRTNLRTKLFSLSRQLQVTGERNRWVRQRGSHNRIKNQHLLLNKINALGKKNSRSDQETQNEGWKAGKCSRPAGSGICLLGRVSISGSDPAGLSNSSWEYR